MVRDFYDKGVPADLFMILIKKYTPEFLQLLHQFEESPAKIIAQTIRSWLEPIIRMWRF